MRHALVSLLLVAACGGGDSDNNPTPDAAPTPDTGPSCTMTTLGGAQAFVDGSDSAILWSAPIATDLGGTGETLINFEFYSGIETSLSGTIDLAVGNQANYKTCAACIRVLTINAAGDAIEKTWFQTGGSITLTEDPFTNQKMLGSADNVTLAEVTVDPMTFESTLVPGGTCLSLGSIQLMADAVPAAWTCAKEAYDDGTTCNCACGEHDPDCDIMAAPVAGCTGAQVCGRDDTCIDVCDVLSTPPVGCPTGTCGFESATRDICYTDAAVVDAAALGGTCAGNALFCGVANTVATGLCDSFEGDDKQCREACDATADCAATEVCAPIIGAKGLCITPPVNDTCELAQLITIGTPVNGRTGGAGSNYNAGLEAATCTGVSQAGADVAYRVVLTANQAITVTLSNVSANFDPSVALVGPGAATVCNATTIACLKGADAGVEAEGETFTYTATTAGTYYLIVDTFYRTQGGSFTLNVTSP